jgi:hypothetical protein
MTSIRSQFGLDFHPFLRNPNNRELSHAPRRVALSTLRPRRPCHLLPTGLSAPPPPFAGRSQHLASSPPSVCQLVPAPRCYSLRGAPAGAMTPYLISYFTQRSSVGRDIEPAVQRSLLCICAMCLLHDGCNGSRLSGRRAAVQRRRHRASVSTAQPLLPPLLDLPSVAATFSQLHDVHPDTLAARPFHCVLVSKEGNEQCTRCC